MKQQIPKEVVQRIINSANVEASKDLIDGYLDFAYLQGGIDADKEILGRIGVESNG